MEINTLTIPRKSSLLGAACVFFSISAALAAPPATVSGTYGTVVIGDLPGMLDRGAELGKSVSPGISGDVIRGQLGMLLGDEGLKSIPAGSGLVVVVPASGRPFFLLETAAGKAETLVNLVKQRLPNAAAKAVSDKLLAIAMDQAALDKATGEMGTAATALLEGNDDKFIVATIDADTLIKDKGENLKSMLKKLSAKAAAAGDSGTTDSANAGTAKAMAFLGELVVAATKRTDVATIKIDISGEGVLFEKTVWPIGGVNLAEPEGPTGQVLLKMIPPADNPMMRYDYYMDTQSAYKAMLPMMSEAMTGIGISGAQQQEIKEVCDLMAQGFGDGFAGWITPGDDGMRGTYLLSIINQDNAIGYLDRAASAMTTGALSQFYTTLGMKTSATLSRNVKTIDGLQAHNFSMSMEPANATDSSLPMSKFYNMKESLITFIENKMLMVIGDVPAEPAVAAVKSGSGSGADLKARAELPPNGVFYLDYNFGAIVEAMGKQDPRMAGVAGNLEGVNILEAGYVDNESIKFMMLIPGEMVSKAAASFKSMATPQSGEPAMDDDSTTDVENSTM